MSTKHDSTFTWPRSQAPPKLYTPKITNYPIITANLANVKQFIKKNDNAKAKKLLNVIQMFLNPDDFSTDNKHIINTIQEEPPFESMIVTNEANNDAPKNVDDIVVPIANIEGKIVVEELPEPFWTRCVPHLCLITLLVMYLAVGAYIYQLIDPAYSSKPFYNVLTMSFQVCFTIGWGNIPPLIGISRLFTLVYAAFGVPLTFAVVSNFGRFISEGYGVQCLFVSNFCPRKNGDKNERQQLAFKDATALLLSHQFIGIILFNTWYGKIGFIKSWYFIWTTSAMIGFGDVIPDPQSLFQAITMLLYFAIGNLFMQAFLLSICYHFHQAYFVIFKMYLYKLKYYLQKKFGETP
uniref:Potassium channel domain-containing protein n=1 Tax=Panagrolaimus davidi TaxID=227884 RepID=A0A914QE29_9BILA